MSGVELTSRYGPYRAGRSSTPPPFPLLPLASLQGDRGRQASARARNKRRKRHSDSISSSVWMAAPVSSQNAMHRHARLQAHCCKAQASSGPKSDDNSLARRGDENEALKWCCTQKEAILVAWPSVDAHRGNCVERAQRQGSPNGKVDEPSATPQTLGNPIRRLASVGRLHFVEGAHVAQAQSGANGI